MNNSGFEVFSFLSFSTWIFFLFRRGSIEQLISNRWGIYWRRNPRSPKSIEQFSPSRLRGASLLNTSNRFLSLFFSLLPFEFMNKFYYVICYSNSCNFTLSFIFLYIFSSLLARDSYRSRKASC